MSETGFGLANLPYGIFSTDDRRRVGVRFADAVLDLSSVFDDAWASEPTLNALMSEGPQVWRETRERVRSLLSENPEHEALIPLADVELHLPIEVADYVDFYASENHATNVGHIFRPDAEPLLPNWKHLPVGYHGRSSTVVVSGTDIVRPSGQRKAPTDDAPTFGPSIRLDVEVELGYIVGVGSNEPVSIDDFADRVFGCVLLNDWSARDIQAWEYVPLGPHLGKSFATSISPWVVPLEALEPARTQPPARDVELLPYLVTENDWALDIDLELELNGQTVSRPPYSSMYYTGAQMLAHMTVNGAASRTGDLFGSGTVSGSEKDQFGSFLELSWGGRDPLQVNGESRTFLEDGDTATIRGSFQGADGELCSFGEVTGRIVASS